jgi:hypothetical protein
MRTSAACLAGCGGAEIAQVGRARVQLDGDLAAVAEGGAVDRGDASGAEGDVGQVAAEWMACDGRS